MQSLYRLFQQISLTFKGAIILMKKILTVTNPTITLFPGYAATGAILENYEETYDWFYSQYIQLLLYNETHRSPDDRPTRGAFFFDFDSRYRARLWHAHAFIEYNWCPFLKIFNCDTKMLMREHEEFISLIKRCINQDYYLFMRLVNEPITAFSDMRQAFPHETFIFGYDDTNREVYFGDYFFKGKRRYSFGTCSYHDVESAAKQTWNTYAGKKHEIALVHYEDKVSYHMNYRYVVDQIYDYLYPSIRISEELKSYIKDNIKINEPKVYLGINVYNYLVDFINEELGLGKTQIDYRMFHGLLDHKRMMKNRLDYLLHKNHLSYNKYELCKEYDCVVKTACIIRNEIIKYEYTHNRDLLNVAQERLLELKQIEFQILHHIFME